MFLIYNNLCNIGRDPQYMVSILRKLCGRNKIRIFVGAEHGFPKDYIKIYRRESNLKKSYLTSFTIPICQSSDLSYFCKKSPQPCKVVLPISFYFSFWHSLEPSSPDGLLD